VVVVIHEIFGLSTWVRGVADQLAPMLHRRRSRPAVASAWRPVG